MRKKKTSILRTQPLRWRGGGPHPRFGARSLCSKPEPCRTRSSTAQTSPVSPPTRRASFKYSNVGAERMLGYTVADVLNKVTPADISDSEEVVARATALSLELGTTITPRLRGIGLQGLAWQSRTSTRLTYSRKDGQPLAGGLCPVTALRKRSERDHRLSADRTGQHRSQAGRRSVAQGGALSAAIFPIAPISPEHRTDEGWFIQIFNVGAEPDCSAMRPPT